MKDPKVSIRYAKSLLDLAQSQNMIDQTMEDMNSVALTIGESHDLEILLNSPVVKADKKVAILREVFGSNLSELGLSFIEIIARKGREGLLGDIAKSFVGLVKELKKIHIAEVVTAVPLDDTARKKIQEILESIQSGELELKETVDPEILGGYILKTADRMIDDSVRTRINGIKKEFTKNPYVPAI